MDLNPFGILKTEHRRRGIVVETETKTYFQAPSGAEYAAPTGLGNWVARVAAKISLRTELSEVSLQSFMNGWFGNFFPHQGQ